MAPNMLKSLEGEGVKADGVTIFYIGGNSDIGKSTLAPTYAIVDPICLHSFTFLQNQWVKVPVWAPAPFPLHSPT